MCETRCELFQKFGGFFVFDNTRVTRKCGNAFGNHVHRSVRIHNRLLHYNMQTHSSTQQVSIKHAIAEGKALSLVVRLKTTETKQLTSATDGQVAALWRVDNSAKRCDAKHAEIAGTKRATFKLFGIQ